LAERFDLSGFLTLLSSKIEENDSKTWPDSFSRQLSNPCQRFYFFAGVRNWLSQVGKNRGARHEDIFRDDLRRPRSADSIRQQIQKEDETQRAKAQSRNEMRR